MDKEQTGNLSSREETSEKLAALFDFVRDIECLDLLDSYSEPFNLFSVLGIERYEIRHSNMLAWLFNPSESHGLGGRCLTEFVKLAIAGGSGEEQREISKDDCHFLLMNTDDFTLSREDNDIDILAVSKSQKTVICIENKIGAGESPNQLEKYEEDVKRRFKGYRQLFVFLTPEGDSASNPEVWVPVSYRDFVERLEKLYRDNKSRIADDAAVLIEHYIINIRRHVVMENEVQNLCRQIYSKHKSAIDLIIESIPNTDDAVKKLLFEKLRANKQGYLVRNARPSTLLRFKTDYMTQLFPDFEEKYAGAWQTGSKYYYEIKTENGHISAWLCVHYKSFNKSDKNLFDAIYEKFPEDRWRNGVYRGVNLVFDSFEEVEEEHALKGIVDSFYDQLTRIISRFEEKAKSIVEQR